MKLLFKIIFACSLLLILKSFCQQKTDKGTDKNDKLLKEFKRETVIYKTINDQKLEMILFMPQVKKFAKTPVMLYTHGGGWGGGDKLNVFTQSTLLTLKSLLKNGFAVAAIDYRLTVKDVSTVYECIVDCKDAARYLLKEANTYNLDENRIGVWGGSAGGHLSLMTALGRNEDFIGDATLKTFDPKIKCVVSYFPLTTFLNPEVLKGSNFENPNRFVAVFGGLLTEKLELAKLASPTEYIKKGNPPILLIHGDQDQVLSIKNSVYFKELADKKGSNVELVTVKGANHGLRGQNTIPSVAEVNKMAADFIFKNL